MAYIEAGKLNTSIDVYGRTDDQDGYGADNSEYTYLFSTRAQVVTGGGGETIQNERDTHTYSKSFIIRTQRAIDDKYKIKYNGRFWRVLYHDDTFDRRMTTVYTELEQE